MEKPEALIIALSTTLVMYIANRMREENSKAFKDLAKRLDIIAAAITPAITASDIEFYVQIGGEKKRVKHMFLKANENLPISIAIKDKFGNPAQVDGIPAWALTDSNFGSIEVSQDGMAALLKPSGMAGAFKVQVKCDADLGAGVKELLGELDVEVVSGEAVTIELTPGEPQPN